MAIEFWHMISNAVGERTGSVNLVSTHFRRREFYKDDWTNEDILVFELFLVLSRSFGGDEYFHQMRYLKRSTRLSDNMIRKSRDKLEELGFISFERKGRFNSNIYKVNYEIIKKNLNLIYRLDELPPEDIKAFKRLMCNFFDYFKTYQSKLEDSDKPELIDNEKRRELSTPIDEPLGEEVGFSPEFEKEMKQYFAKRGEQLE